jgi:bis(5'-nucleosyl)-tetraphosphatase (symmetrical)
MSTYAIGDIQGCMEPLQRLLNHINFDPQRDRLWLAGDLINRGPDSLGVLKFLYAIRESISFVLGNHDLHFLAVAFGYRKPGKSDTLDALMQADERDQLVNWLRTGKLLHHDEQVNFTMVHAGIPPQWDLTKAMRCAREIETLLQTEEIHRFLPAMYGNSPNIWSEQLIDEERWRVITNYLTRMRFCTNEGELELETKTEAAEAPPGFSPWFAHSHRKTASDNIIFGHWAALAGHANTPNVFALDTGCVWGGSLTALRLEDKKIFSCNCN